MNDRNQHGGAFPATAWSLVGRAGSATSAERSAALNVLLTRYLPALRARLVLEKGLRESEAEDLLQDFIAQKILEQDLIAQADRAKGRFRTFVLTALDRYAIDRTRFDRASKRSAPHADAEALADVAARDSEPSRAFDRQWARQVIDEAVARMNAHCQATGRLDLWELFCCRILDPALADVPPEPYERLIERFKFASPGAASNALVTAKRMFERSLRSVVREYAADENEIEAELAELRAVVCGG